MEILKKGTEVYTVHGYATVVVDTEVPKPPYGEF
jgi:hypothetical protein